MSLSEDKIIYHCVGLTPTRYWRFTGKAPMSIEGDVQIQSNNQSANGIWRIGDADIWVTGQGGTTTTTMTLRRSQNNGATWSNEYARVPHASPEAHNNHAIWGKGAAVAGNLWVVNSNQYSILQAPDPINSNPFVVRSQDIPPYNGYVYIHGAYDETYGLRVWFTRYIGKIYLSTNGTSFAADNGTGLGTLGQYDPICVWVDGPRNRVYLLHRSGSLANYTFKIFYKVADDTTTAWTLDETFGPYASTPPSGAGRRYLYGDPVTGSVYLWSDFAVTQLGKGQLWRRDPDTTVWTMVKQTAGNPGGTLGIHVIDDENLLCVGTVGIQRDSEGYHTYGSGEDYSWPSNRIGAAVWAPTYPDQDPPVITPVTPYNGETGVEKDSSITFTVTDDPSGVELSSIKAWVKGALVFTDEEGVNGWAATVTAITYGYRITLSHTSRLTYFEDGETVGVRADAEDTEGNPGSGSWSFSVTRDMGLRIYPMLFEGVRKADEENN